MVESAAHLVDHVFPEAPVRQRRLSRHGGLRACEQEALPACRPRVGADLSISAAFLVGRAAGSADPSAGGGSARYFELRGAALRPDRRVRRPHALIGTPAKLLALRADRHADLAGAGAVTVIQRFGSALNLNRHLHMLFLDGAPNHPQLARLAGFSLHAATVCEAHQHSRPERLCRCITLS